MRIGYIKLIQTSSAFPEQYDAIIRGHRVGYLRLRHGYFTVNCPDDEGELVYEAYPNGQGMFDEEERSFYLKAARQKILNYLKP